MNKQRFYITKYATEEHAGVIVAEGRLTAKQAKVDPAHAKTACYIHTLSAGEFEVDLETAKKVALKKIDREISECRTRIEALENMRAQVEELEPRTPVWTNTGVKR